MLASTTQSGRNVQRSPASKRISLTDSIYEALRDRIVFSEIPAEEILVEARLAEAHGVSKTPVREALALLSQEGLVEVLPRVGYRITPIGLRDVHEVFHLRFLLEPEAAALAARRSAEEDVVDLRRRSRDDLARISGEAPLSLRAYVGCHDAFHLGIAALSGSRRLVRFIRTLLRDSTRVRVRDPLMGVEGLDEDRETTELVAEALLTRDEARARTLMIEHLTSSKARILAKLNDPELTARGEGVVVT